MLTRTELYDRIQGLPPGPEREEAIELAVALYSKRNADDGLGRDPEQRRKLAGDPWKYARDVFGYTLTPQQERCLEEIEKYDYVLIPSGNNLGKTWVLSWYGIYRFDAVAALPDEALGLAEQGGRVLLPGPDHATIKATIYDAAMMHALIAEARGFLMPGYRSAKSVLWRVRPQWEFEAFAPQKKAGMKDDPAGGRISHTVSGRHHANQVALIEEGQGVEEPIWAGVEGMCSGHGNKIISAFNPDVASGPAYIRAEKGSWRVIHLSAFDHPNVRGRSIVVPGGAVGYLTVDKKVRDYCHDRGLYPKNKPDAEHRDFVYALPPALGAKEEGPRKDGHLGHRRGTLHVYRPTARFEAQVLGLWPRSYDARLFSRMAWEAAVRRSAEAPDPEEIPDVVGLDCARTGEDSNCAAPRWGMSADEALRAYIDAQAAGEEAVAELLEMRRIRVGHIRTLPNGDGPTVAEALVREFPYAVYHIDEGGPGYSILDHSVRVVRVQAVGVSFGAAAPEPTPGEPWSENLRTAMYVQAAMATNLGMVDPPDDPQLKEEILAHELLHRYKVVDEVDPATRQHRKVRKPSVLLIEKDVIKERIGRSPDKSDAFVLSLYRGAPRRRRVVFAS